MFLTLTYRVLNENSCLYLWFDLLEVFLWDNVANEVCPEEKLILFYLDYGEIR